jgi:hypothetical protein
MLEFKKFRVPPDIHFTVLIIEKYHQYGEYFSHHNIKIFHLTVNPPTEFIINQCPHSEN